MGRAVLPKDMEGNGEGGEAALTAAPPAQQRVFIKGSTKINCRK